MSHNFDMYMQTWRAWLKSNTRYLELSAELRQLDEDRMGLWRILENKAKLLNADDHARVVEEQFGVSTSKFGGRISGKAS